MDKPKHPSQTPDRLERATVKKLAIKRMEQLSGDSQWNLLQQLVQEIHAHYIVTKQRRPGAHEIIRKLLPDIIDTKYPITDLSDPEARELNDALKEAIPSIPTLNKWINIKGWEKAVWLCIKGTGLFTQEKRHEVINSLFFEATEGKNINAAKVWLTLSGDYSEKGETKNEAVDQFREINNVLRSKK